MNMILSADNNWAIGLNNKLLVSIPADMKFFRQTTTGNVVVMGRKTLESFPGGTAVKEPDKHCLKYQSGLPGKRRHCGTQQRRTFKRTGKI